MKRRSKKSRSISMKQLFFGGAICLLAAGCAHQRSISHSDYPVRATRCWGPEPMSDGAFQYRGELSEMDVLGIDPARLPLESEIREAAEKSKRVTLKPGC